MAKCPSIHLSHQSTTAAAAAGGFAAEVSRVQAEDMDRYSIAVAAMQSCPWVGLTDGLGRFFSFWWVELGLGNNDTIFHMCNDSKEHAWLTKNIR